MALTDVKCRSAKSSGSRIKLSDGGGLQFWVQPNGSRLWQLVHQYGGKQAQMAPGPYPQVSLMAARALREEIKAKIRAGIDPAAQRRRDDPWGLLSAVTARFTTRLSGTIQQFPQASLLPLQKGLDLPAMHFSKRSLQFFSKPLDIGRQKPKFLIGVVHAQMPKPCRTAPSPASTY